MTLHSMTLLSAAADSLEALAFTILIAARRAPHLSRPSGWVSPDQTRWIDWALRYGPRRARAAARLARRVDRVHSGLARATSLARPMW